MSQIVSETVTDTEPPSEARPDVRAATRRATSPRRTRQILRVVHLVLGGIAGFVIYAPPVSDQVQRAILAVVVVPGLTVTGLWIWQQARVRRLLSRSKRPAVS